MYGGDQRGIEISAQRITDASDESLSCDMRSFYMQKGWRM